MFLLRVLCLILLISACNPLVVVDGNNKTGAGVNPLQVHSSIALKVSSVQLSDIVLDGTKVDVGFIIVNNGNTNLHGIDKLTLPRVLIPVVISDHCPLILSPHTSCERLVRVFFKKSVIDKSFDAIVSSRFNSKVVKSKAVRVDCNRHIPDINPHYSIAIITQDVSFKYKEHNLLDIKVNNEGNIAIEALELQIEDSNNLQYSILQQSSCNNVLAVATVCQYVIDVAPDKFVDGNLKIKLLGRVDGTEYHSDNELNITYKVYANLADVLHLSSEIKDVYANTSDEVEVLLTVENNSKLRITLKGLDIVQSPITNVHLLKSSCNDILEPKQKCNYNVIFAANSEQNSPFIGDIFFKVKAEYQSSSVTSNLLDIYYNLQKISLPSISMTPDKENLHTPVGIPVHESLKLTNIGQIDLRSLKVDLILPKVSNIEFNNVDDSCSGRILLRGQLCIISFDVVSQTIIKGDIVIVTHAKHNGNNNYVTHTAITFYTTASSEPSIKMTASAEPWLISTPLTLTINNDGKSVLNNVVLHLINHTGGEDIFYISKDTCHSVALAVGATCTIELSTDFQSVVEHSFQLYISALYNQDISIYKSPDLTVNYQQ